MVSNVHRRSFIFCVHAHQPVGNFDRVFQDAFQKCYQPFFKVLEKHPRVPVVCHLSGSLLDWLSSNQPQFMKQLRSLAERGQVEFLGGAYYEPIYGAIPVDDLAGQIGLMREKIEQYFGQAPEGVWLTERVWDPHLVGLLKKNGVRYTVLDDFHLEKGGIKHPVTGYYRAQDRKDTIDVFASVRPLRYLIPFQRPEDVMNYLYSQNSAPERVVVFADDCEKFGLWPGTESWVFRKDWLDEFFTLLESDRQVALYNFRQYRQRHKPRKTVRIPHASYSEMMDWSEGSFHHFFKKYDESRYMKDRMWNLSDRIRRAKKHLEPANYEKASVSLYKAQCNCSYWHGVFGGLYLHHLRSAVFENLMKAEKVLKAGTDSREVKFPAVEKLALDSGERWVIRQRHLTSYFCPQEGGVMEELDYLPLFANLCCTLKRRREHYHALIAPGPEGQLGASAMAIHQLLGVKDSHLNRELHFDTHRRVSLLDHCVDETISVDQFNRGLYKERGDFSQGRFEATRVRTGAMGGIRMRRKGAIRLNGRSHAVVLTKTLTPQNSSRLRISYEWTNASKATLEFVWAMEFNLSIGLSNDLAEGFTEKKTKRFKLSDSWRGIEVDWEFNHPMDVAGSPVHTVSGSEGGLEKTYQGVGVLFQRPMRLLPGEEKSIVFSLRVS